ncbi:MAG: DNA/RNA nuclease SfsA, partial [Gammaproteobacteria bacterium]|nr:DNA/RNA nuclease SfsA [Gammaproteobacteria bacterium]
AHCPNTGSMRNCRETGSRVWLAESHNPKRKLRYTWELVEVGGRYLACINTNRANHLVREAIENQGIPELSGYSSIRTERPYGKENSRIDLLLSGEQGPDCYIEVKNVTLLDSDGLGLFPDAVTVRGRKHLRELMEMVRKGYRAVLFFNVAHTGIRRIAPAWSIDPDYAQTLAEALDTGVEVLAYGASISSAAIEVSRRLKFTLHP